jgi:hypothetical protein
MSEHLDHVIRSNKGKSWAIEISHTRNGIPVRREREQSDEDKIHPQSGWDEPHAKEIYHHFASESVFETLCQLVSFGIMFLVQVVRERNLLDVVFG